MTFDQVVNDAATRLRDQLYTQLLDNGHDPALAYEAAYENSDVYDLEDFDEDRDSGLWDDIDETANV